MKNLLIILTLLTLVACNNDDDQPQNPIDLLPPATQTGENTFGCLINGEPFVVTNTNNQVAIYQGGNLTISGETRVNEFFYEISVFISESAIGQEIMENTTYNLNNSSSMKGQYYREDLNCFYFTSQSVSGTLTISNFDNLNYVVSGEFEFQAISDNCQETINITNGRFDLQYIP